MAVDEQDLLGERIQDQEASLASRELTPVLSMRRALSAVVLAAWGAFLLYLVIKGDAKRYLSPGLIWLAAITGSILVFTAYCLWRARHVGHVDADSPWHEMECRCRSLQFPSGSEMIALIALVVPLVAVSIVPAGSLGSFAAQQKGLSLSDSGAADAPPPPPPDDAIVLPSNNVDGPVRALSMRQLVYSAAFDYERLQTGLSEGEVVKTDGFVSHPDPKHPERVVVTRFLVTCCVADATPIGVEVRGAGISKLKDDTWVVVTGPVGWPDRSSYDITRGYPTPWMDAEKVDVVPQPSDIYVY